MTRHESVHVCVTFTWWVLIGQHPRQVGLCCHVTITKSKINKLWTQYEEGMISGLQLSKAASWVFDPKYDLWLYVYYVYYNINTVKLNVLFSTGNVYIWNINIEKPSLMFLILLIAIHSLSNTNTLSELPMTTQNQSLQKCLDLGLSLLWAG